MVIFFIPMLREIKFRGNSLCQYMTSNVINATQNLMNISGVPQNEKNYFAHPVKAITSKRYFQCLGCLWEEVEAVLLMAVLVVVELARPLPVQDADSTLFTKS